MFGFEAVAVMATISRVFLAVAVVASALSLGGCGAVGGAVSVVGTAVGVAADAAGTVVGVATAPLR